MKIVIIGAAGTIGKHVTQALEAGNQIVKVGARRGDLQVDISSSESIKALFDNTGNFDALVCVAGDGHMGPWKKMTEADFRIGIQSKLMGQVNLVLLGRDYVNPGGSFTLTSGILSHDPVKMGAGLSTMNGAINSFVIGAAIEMENGVRINAVSPGVVEDSPQYFAAFPGHIPVTMDRVTRAYVKCVLGAANGQIVAVH